MGSSLSLASVFHPLRSLASDGSLIGMSYDEPNVPASKLSLLVALTLAATALPSAPVFACSVVLPPDYEGSAMQRRSVKLRIEKATAIVDGEVIRTWTRETPALVRVHHVLKGDVKEVIQVGGEGAGADCSIALQNLGQRSRMILSGGPERYDLFYDYSEARLEDHFLKSDRRNVWPYYPGRTSIEN